MKKKLIVSSLLIAFVLMTASTAFAASYAGTSLYGWKSYNGTLSQGEGGTLMEHCTECYITKFKNDEVESQHVAYFCTRVGNERYGRWQIGQGQNGELTWVPSGDIHIYLQNESQYYGQYRMRTEGRF